MQEPQRQDTATGRVVTEVTRVLTETRHAPAAAIRPDARLEDLGIDSLASIQMVVALEEALGFAVRDQDRSGMLDIETVEDLIDFVRGQISRQTEVSR
jgi:acyl carrier protein